MNILLIWPPVVPAYFNALYHVPLWETAAFLRRNDAHWHVRARDAGALNLTYAQIARELVKATDVLAIHNEFETLAGVRMLIAYCRMLSPRTKIITYGRASSIVPGCLERMDLDAIVEEGDWEVGVAQYVEFLAGRRTAEQMHGVAWRCGGQWRRPQKGVYLPPEQWADPDVAEIPWDYYNRLYGDPQMHFSGLAGKRELPVTIARGCPIGCEFCINHIFQGKKERRRTVASVLRYLEVAARTYSFDYFATLAPTFTLDRDWVMEFCDALRGRSDYPPWKTCTTLHDLDESLIEAMTAARCLRLTIGLETLDENAMACLPARKRPTEQRLRELAACCRRVGLELNCLVMLGLPGQTEEGLRHTFGVLRDIGAKVRPMIYTDFSALSPEMDEQEIALRCRQLIHNPQMSLELKQLIYRFKYATAEADMPSCTPSFPA